MKKRKITHVQKNYSWSNLQSSECRSLFIYFLSQEIDTLSRQASFRRLNSLSSDPRGQVGTHTHTKNADKSDEQFSKSLQCVDYFLSPFFPCFFIFIFFTVYPAGGLRPAQSGQPDEEQPGVAGEFLPVRARPKRKVPTLPFDHTVITPVYQCPHQLFSMGGGKQQLCQCRDRTSGVATCRNHPPT